MSVQFNKFNSFKHAVGTKKHDLHSDTIVAILTNVAPTSSMDVGADITGELATGNGYTNGGEDTQNTYTEQGPGLGSALVGVDIVWTATGEVGPFRYVVLKNSTAPNEELVGWYGHPTSITLQADQTFTLDFGTSIFTDV